MTKPGRGAALFFFPFLLRAFSGAALLLLGEPACPRTLGLFFESPAPPLGLAGGETNGSRTA